MSETITRENLQSVYKNHWDRLDGIDEPETNHFVEVTFDCEGEVSAWIQFQWGMMNAAKLNEERLNTWKRIIEDEGLTIDNEGDVFITTFDAELHDAERLAVLTEQMLNEIYDQDLNGVVSIDETDL